MLSKVAAGLLCWVLCSAMGGRAYAAGAAASINVVIVGVTQFDDSRWFNPTLSASIDKAVEDLRDFATRSLNANVVLLTAPGDTRSDRLLRLARQELRTLSADSVTLVFVLSHGAVLPAHPGEDADVLIAASDTPYRDDPDAISRDKALLLRHDLLNSVWSVRHGAVFFFIDTCYSGAAADWESVTKAFQAYRGGGVHLMCLAAATAIAKAFKADFTEALVQAWKTAGNEQCHQPYQARDFLHHLMLGLDSDLGPNDAHPTLVVPYYGDLCLESFSTRQSIVFFYNNSNRDLTVSIERPDEPAFLRQPDLPPEMSTAVPLQRVAYNVRLFEDNALRGAEVLDLTGDAARVVIVGGAESIASVARAYEAAAGSSAAETLAPEVADALRVRAYSAYVAAGDRPAALRVMRSHPALLGALEASPVAAVANKRAQHSDVLQTVMKTGDARAGAAPFERWRTVLAKGPAAPDAAPATPTQKLAAGARDLQFLGDFEKAGSVWLTAADTAKPSEVKAFATQAYLSFAAAKLAAAAAFVRRKFGLDVGDACPACPAAERAALAKSSNADHFGAVALERVVKQ